MNDLANSNMTQNSQPVRIDFNTPELQRKRRIRALKDRLTRWYVLVGGLAVLAAITLIFFYLAYVVLPLFQGAELTSKKALAPTWLQQDAGKPLMIALEEQNLVGMRVSDKGQALFFDTKTGNELKRVDLPVPADTQVTSISSDQPGSPLVVLGLSNGQALVFHHTYKITYPDNKKTITPGIDYPYGEQPFVLDEQGRALEHVNVNVNGDTLVLAGSTGAHLQVVQLTRSENMMTEEVTTEQHRIVLPQMTEAVKNIFIDPRQQWLYVINGRATADVFSLFVVMPVGILLAGFGWSRLPESIRLRVPDGWEAAILIPVILFIGWFALYMSPFLETWFFGGDMRLWITNDLGITYDQRNALVVGIAMGFAVIPNIYSIAEDAVFSVPRSLTLGSLALGATPWQTLTRVVILTASPGIFSALMIGMGRAVGETMIVLMATGNTPVMEMNLFEGMRTLAANVAVEMPESEVGGSHYRVLFLAALVLLMFTFVMNTLAELIRQRLRKKYSSL